LLDSPGVSKPIDQLLAEMIVDSINFDEATLEEVVEYLTVKSREVDPSGNGVNFVLQLDAEDDASRGATLNLRLRNVPMFEIVKLVARGTGTVYRIDGSAVKFSSKASSDRILVTERFEVPPDFLSSAATDGGGGAAAADPFADALDASTSGLSLKRLTAKEFLSNLGVTFPDGASASFNPANSMLLVRNTPTNMQLIRSIVKNSRTDRAKQVEIHVTMIDIAEQELNELGFDWLLGQFNAPGSDRVFGGGGTVGNSPSSGSAAEARSDYPFIPPGSETPVGRYPLTSGLRTGRQWNQGDAISNILLGAGESVLSNSSSIKSPAIFGASGAFTDPVFQMVMRGLSQSKSGDVITKPSIVTRSGQRATIDIIREFPYPIEFDPPEIPQSNGINFADGTSAASNGAAPVTPAHPAAFQVRNLGTHLEVEPVIGPDNYTVELNLAPELVRFEGFINYGSPITTTSTDLLGGSEAIELTDNRILQPVFKTIKNTANVVVWDGATVVFGGLIEDRTVHVRDKTPILGDTPFIGRFFRSSGEERNTRAVMFFVKVNIIDPAGSRINAR
jgi:general secretion pathway protein D